jgi:transcriptional regulator with XRE-family HTH domain
MDSINPVPSPATELGSRARAARKQKGLSIRAAAEKLKCSPGFVHQLELGKPTARMDKVQQALAGLGLRLVVEAKDAETPFSRAHAQSEARSKQALYEEKLARAHDRIAALLALGEVGDEALERARAQVRKWHEHRICSDWYVARWNEILAGSPAGIAARIVALGKEDARALFQNTPFGFLVRDFLRS